MIARTIYVGKPSTLRVDQEQFVVECGGETHRLPLEDISTVEVDCPQVMITSPLVSKLAEYNIALLHCGRNHMPVSMSLPISKHSSHTERLRAQLNVSAPRRKSTWKQIVKAKIINQADVLRIIKAPDENVRALARSVRSGDSTNREGLAAKRYWAQLFQNPIGRTRFVRDPEGEYPNQLFNYGYAVIRALVARGLVSTGMHPSIGIFHKNKYNAFCLADDVMEPYRPFVDLQVYKYLLTQGFSDGELNPKAKSTILQLPVTGVVVDEAVVPLMIAVQRTCASLWEVLAGHQSDVVLPLLASGQQMPVPCSGEDLI